MIGTKFTNTERHEEGVSFPGVSDRQIINLVADGVFQ